jgi:hypothetical protein
MPASLCDWAGVEGSRLPAHSVASSYTGGATPFSLWAMLATKAPLGRSRRTGRWRWRDLAKQFALLAIALQVLVVQPHIEPAALGAFAHEASIAGQPLSHDAVATSDAHGKAAACIICQAALSGRTAIAANAASATFEAEALRIAEPLPQAPALSATPSHIWRSRGPPSLI